MLETINSLGLCWAGAGSDIYIQLYPVTGHVVISSLVSLVWKLGFSQIPKKISSASMLDVARALPVLRMEMAAAASIPVTEKVDCRPFWFTSLGPMTS